MRKGWDLIYDMVVVLNRYVRLCEILLETIS